jgi:hypothetical protein
MSGSSSTIRIFRVVAINGELADVSVGATLSEVAGEVEVGQRVGRYSPAPAMGLFVVRTPF